jgi:hypothetical protein
VHHLHGAAGEPEGHGPDRTLARPVHQVVHLGDHELGRLRHRRRGRPPVRRRGRRRGARRGGGGVRPRGGEEREPRRAREQRHGRSLGFPHLVEEEGEAYADLGDGFSKLWAHGGGREVARGCLAAVWGGGGLEVGARVGCVLWECDWPKFLCGVF